MPQFASAEAGSHDEDGEILLAGLIEPMGILTLSLVAGTFALGVFRRRRNPKLMLKIHKICGASALVSGAVHATLVMFLH